MTFHDINPVKPSHFENLVEASTTRPPLPAEIGEGVPKHKS